MTTPSISILKGKVRLRLSISPAQPGSVHFTGGPHGRPGGRLFFGSFCLTVYQEVCLVLHHEHVITDGRQWVGIRLSFQYHFQSMDFLVEFCSEDSSYQMYFQNPIVQTASIPNDVSSPRINMHHTALQFHLNVGVAFYKKCQHLFFVFALHHLRVKFMYPSFQIIQKHKFTLNRNVVHIDTSWRLVTSYVKTYILSVPECRRAMKNQTFPSELTKST